MSFFCEYCGAKIDAEKYSKCPHCGASFNNNKIYKKLEEERLKEKKINNELKDKMLKYTINTFKFSKFFLIIPIIIFILILIFAVTMIINFNKSNNIPDDQNFFFRKQ